jgi:two-component system, OmpR family, response regulator
MTILIVEDNLILAKNIARRLRQCGHLTRVAANALELREAIEDSAVSGVCLDLQLPDGNGLDILEREIRPRYQTMPVLIMTGTGTDDDRDRAKQSGVTAFLIKPFALSEIECVFDGLQPRDKSSEQFFKPASDCA